MEKGVEGVEGYLSDTEVIISIFYICGLLDMVPNIKFWRVWKKTKDVIYEFSNVVDSIDNIYLKLRT